MKKSNFEAKVRADELEKVLAAVKCERPGCDMRHIGYALKKAEERLSKLREGETGG